MFFDHKHHQYHVSTYFWAAKKLQLTAGACLSSQVFEELVIMKSAWGLDLYNVAAWTVVQVEEVALFDFKKMLAEDTEYLAWEEELEQDAIVIDY